MLTGISRYHEMSYIIGLLIDHDQFESLVHTGIEKVTNIVHAQYCVYIVLWFCLILIGRTASRSTHRVPA